MKHKEAEQFAQKVFAAWQSGELAQFEALYDPKLTGQFDQNLPLTYQDLLNRFKYVATQNTHRAFDLKYLMVEGNKLMLDFCYTAEDLVQKTTIRAPTQWLFTIENHKIVEVEILTSYQFKYKS